MFRLFCLFACCLIASCAITALIANDRPPLGLTTAGVVVGVVDGDTVDVEVKKIVRVRLLDCWAPESKIDRRLAPEKQVAEKAAGKASKEHLEQLSLGKQVTLFVPSRKSGKLSDVLTMNRVLGIVWVEKDQDSLNEKQVKAGHATTQKRDELK